MSPEAIEEQDVLSVLNQYVTGYIHADEAMLRDVFADDAKMNGYVGDRLVAGSPERFISRVANGPPLAEAGQEMRYEISALSITRNAASATLKEYDFGGFNFIDYMHLIKRDGQWKIISKTFSTFCS